MTQVHDDAVAVLREAARIYAANPAHGNPGHAADGTGPHCAITAIVAAEIRLRLSCYGTAQTALVEAAGVDTDGLTYWEEQASTEAVVGAFERGAETLAHTGQ
jgi:hypothetical protein